MPATVTRPATSVPAASGILRLAAPLPLARGGEIASCDIAWELLGAGNAPLVVALGGISAGRHIAAHDADATPGWWQPIAGAGHTLDTRQLRVLGIDWLGGAGASTGPRTLSPFPAVATGDQAHAVSAVLDHLGVTRAHAIIGSSYGGMVALAFAALFPARLERAIVFSAAHRSHPLATALRALQRRIVRLGLETGRATDALCIARALAMTTYRTAEEFEERFDTAPLGVEPIVRFPVEDYLDHCGARFAEAFPPESFLRLSESIDLHDIEPDRVGAPVTLVSVKADPLAPPWQMRELAARLGSRARLIEIESVYGHDAFLKEVGMVSSILTRALATACTGAGAT